MNNKGESMMESVETTTVVARSWFEERMIQWGLDKHLAKLGIDANELFHGVLFFAGGMMLGFLCSKYLKTFFIALLSAVIAVKLLEYNNVVALNMDEFYRVFGMAPDMTFESFFTALWTWIKDHAVITVSGSIGFLIGFKLS